MAVSFRGVNNAAGQNAGVTTPAGTTSITPTLPASTAIGDRVFMIQCGSNTSATSPANWTLLGTKDTVVGSGAVAAAGGLRYITVHWRDRDTAWSMPAMDLTSATQNSHWIGAVSVSKDTYDTFNTPTISTVGATFNTAGTSYTDTSAASFTTHTGGFLIIGSCFNDNVTSSAVAVTQSGATFGTVTERCDGGTATGNDVAGKVHTCDVTTGASATITQTQTISAASQGETLFIEQTVTSSPPSGIYVASIGSALTGASSATANVPVPGGVVAGSFVMVFFYFGDVITATISAPDGTWFTPSDIPVDHPTTGIHRLYLFWHRATGSEAGTYAFTTSSGSAWRQAVAFRFENVIASGEPWEATSANLTAVVSTTGVVSVTTLGPDRLLVWASNNWGGKTYTPPTGFTEQFDYAQTVAVEAGIGVATLAQPAAGPSGSVTATMSAAENSTAWLGALKPVAGAVVIPGRAVQQVPITRSSLY